MNASNDDQLYGGNDTFADRQKKLFDQLSIAERECNRGQTTDVEIVPMDIDTLNSDDGWRLPRGCKRRKSETRQFRGKESIFKRPEGPAPRNNHHSIPDHHRNPHKWMKYSLDDVSTTDMTDRSNARTAFAFLEELKARRMKEDLKIKENQNFSENSSDRHGSGTSNGSQFIESKQSTGIQFKKPHTARSSNCRNPIIVNPEEKPVFLSTKVLMPEYVVGQKQKQKQKRKVGEGGKLSSVVKVDRTKELKLNHLEELYDEDETI